MICEDTTMKELTGLFRDGAVSVHYYGDNVCPHYLLDGSRFKEKDELLKMMVQYAGACTVDPQEFARNGSSCDFDCLHCDRSIYHLISAKERMFHSQCGDLCRRTPHVDDEWEISAVEHNGEFKYETIHFLCKEAIDDTSIVGLIIDYLRQSNPGLVPAARYCYVKVRRFDMERAFDVSVEASKLLFAAFK